MSTGWEKRIYRMTVLENHIDTFGHVNHATYLQLLELARWESITAQGMGMAYVQKHKIGPVILELQIRYKKELHLRDLIRIETQVQSFEGRIGEIKQEIFSEESDTCHCSATIKFGIFDLTTRKLIAPSPEWKRAVGYLSEI